MQDKGLQNGHRAHILQTFLQRQWWWEQKEILCAKFFYVTMTSRLDPNLFFFRRRWLHITFGFFLATVIHYLTFFAKNFIKFSQNTFITTNLLFLELIYHSEDSFLMDWSLNQINAWYRHENISDYDTSSFLMRNWEKFKPVILFHSPMLCLIFIINASCSNTSGGLKSAASLRQ